MIKRRISKQIKIGDVKIGGDALISVQSMLNTDTRDISKSIEQINKLQDAGCELIRLAVLNSQAASAIKELKKFSKVPLIADIHFDYRLAIESINNGIDALRLNHGNIGNIDNIKKVINLAKQQNIPIRIGINAGSLEKKQDENNNLSLPEKMVQSALSHIKILEDCNFDLIKVSLKSSSVIDTIQAYQLISDKIPYPLHLGITESGTKNIGTIKSSVGLGTLLALGIGDTIRVSLSDDPIEEVFTGYEILKSLNLRTRGINFISCLFS